MNSTNKTKIEDKFTVEAQMEMIRKAIRKMMKQRQKALNMKPHLYVFDKYIEADTYEELKQKVKEYVKETYTDKPAEE